MSAAQQATAVFFNALAQHTSPRKVLTVSQWADAHRVLSTKGSSEAGPWKTARMPYLKEIMDCLSARSTVRRVVLIKSAQVGGTEIGLNWLGYVMHHNPGPMLTVVPTLEVRKRWVSQRLAPMLVETPELAALFDARKKRDGANSEEIKDFPGGMMVIGGANSPASLASMPIRDVLLDEVDRFPWQVGQEGDPIGLIDERQKTFPRRKTLLVSTPTVREASRIEEEWERSDQRRYHVPCPHCSQDLVLRWANLRWDTALKNAWYVCEHCGAEIEEHHKTQMLAFGRWVPANPGVRTRGYHINGLYAPLGLGYTWRDLADEFMRCKDDRVKLKRFINTALGETWEDRSRDVRANHLIERAEPYPLRQPPPGCLVLTAGIDVQDDRFAIIVLGWGQGETCWVLDYVELPANPARVRDWAKLTEWLSQPMTNTHGVEMSISAAGIDTGGHFTHETYNYVRKKPVRRIMAVKGASTPSKPVLAGRPQPQDVNHRGKTIKKGVLLWLVGTDTAKHALFARLIGDQGASAEDRQLHFSDQLPAEFYDQITAEVFDPEKNKWVKRRGRRNEAIDCWVYGFAAALHPEVRIHAKRPSDWRKLAAVIEPQPETEKEDTPDTPEAPPGMRKTRRAKQRPAGGFVNQWRK